MMQKYSDTLKWNVGKYIMNSSLFGITDTFPIFKESKTDSFIHLYFDWKNGGDRAIKLIEDVYITYKLACKAVDKGEKPIIPVEYKNIIILNEKYEKELVSKKDGEGSEIEEKIKIKYTLDFKEDIIQDRVNSKGFSAIATSEEMTAEEANQKYGKTDNSEVCYKYMKAIWGLTQPEHILKVQLKQKCSYVLSLR